MTATYEPTIVDVQREHIERLLAPYVRARTERDAAAKDVENIAKLLKSFLADRPGEVIFDGETGIEASLNDRRAPGRACDLNALYEKDSALFEQLLRNGCLKVDETALKRAGALVAGIDRFLGPEPITSYLQVVTK